MVRTDFYSEDIGLEVGDRFAARVLVREIIDSRLSVTVKFDNGNIKKLNVEIRALGKFDIIRIPARCGCELMGIRDYKQNTLF